MKQISGIIESIITSDENEILCEIKLDEILSPYFSTIKLHAEIKGIGNIIDKKEISKKIHLLVNQRFQGLFLRPIGHNKAEIQIQ